MKPELKAMVVESEAHTGLQNDDVTTASIFSASLASLHWRGNELWAGPIEVGTAWQPNPEEWHAIVGSGRGLGPYVSKTEARAALKDAAREQIIKWFKEQME